MPADQLFQLALGSGGLNLRDQASQLRAGEVVDTLNWQLDQNLALVKRLGMHEWADELPADALEVFSFEPSGQTPIALAHAADGHVYWRTDATIWASIDAGLSTSQPAGFVQYLDKVYWCDGQHAVRQWDGVTLTLLPASDLSDIQTVTITGTPAGGTFKLALNGELTGNLNWNASAGDLQTALSGLTGIGAGNVQCTGGALPGSGIVVTFIGALANRLVPLMTHTDALTGGTAPAVHVTHTTPGQAAVPESAIMALWRNRLWVAVGRRVWWSKAGDPTDFTTKTNFADFPDDTAITALAAAPNIASGADGSDGILVFSRERMHRITDDSDNILGTVTGGANVLVDGGQGCVSQRSVAQLRGRIYLLGQNGVYSTDGHTALRVESKKIGPLFNELSPGRGSSFIGLAWKGRYLLGVGGPADSANTRVLELNLDLQTDGEGQHAWMAHTIPARCWVVRHTQTGDQLIAGDASANDGAFVRQLFVGGYDIDGADVQNAITARARSGAEMLGINAVKRVRRVKMYGTGRIALSISSDFESAAGETAIFDMTGEESRWNEGFWNEGTWGPDSTTKPAIGYYTTGGSFLAFELVESSTDARTRPPALGLPAGELGGAAVYAMTLTLTPLL